MVELDQREERESKVGWGEVYVCVRSCVTQQQLVASHKGPEGTLSLHLPVAAFSPRISRGNVV